MKPQMSVLSTARKLMIVLETIRNWYMLLFDKFGFLYTVTYSFRNGMKLRCRSRSTDINEACVVAGGLEYPEDLCQLTGEFPVVIDCGGNIGAFTIWLTTFNKPFKAYIIEPHPGNMAVIRENLALNGVQAQLNEVAISGVNGTANLDISGSYDSFKLGENGMEVRTITLSQFIKDNNITHVDLLKIDIEGAEYEMINKDLESFAPYVQNMLLEFHAPLESKQSKSLLMHLRTMLDVQVIKVTSGGGVLFCKSILLKPQSLQKIHEQ